MPNSTPRQDASKKIDVSDSCLFIIAEQKSVTDLVSKQWNDFGFSNVHVFNNPIAAVEKLHYVQADLIVADDNLPGITLSYLVGVANKLDHQKNVSIAALTTDNSIGRRQKLKEAGAMWVLHQPATAQDLLLCTIEAMDRKVMQIQSHQLQRPKSLSRPRSSRRQLSSR